MTFEDQCLADHEPKTIQEIALYLGFIQHSDPAKAGLYLKEINNGNDTAFLDYRKSKGGQLWTANKADHKTVPEFEEYKRMVELFMEKQDQDYSINKTPEPKEQGSKTPPNTNKQSSNLPCTSGESSSLMVPAGTIKDAVELFKVYEQAKKEILNDHDVLWIGINGAPTEKGKGQPHIKRSGWRKLARFFNLSVEPIKRERIGTAKDYTWIYTVKVSHSNGAFFVGDGAASSNDKFFTKGGRIAANEEDVMMKAETVAINRTISDMLGGGEVSAEEVEK